MSGASVSKWAAVNFCSSRQRLFISDAFMRTKITYRVVRAKKKQNRHLKLQCVKKNPHIVGVFGVAMRSEMALKSISVRFYFLARYFYRVV